MRRCICLVLVAIACYHQALPAGGSSVTAVTSSRLDKGLRAQQTLTTDLAAAVFVALHDAYSYALTNMLQASAVLAAFTNGLDAAEQADVAAAINHYTSATLATLDTFLQSQQQQNDNLRQQIYLDIHDQVGTVVAEKVQAYANGIVGFDNATNSWDLIDQTTAAVDAQSRALTVKVCPREYLPGVPSRFKASLFVRDASALQVLAPVGTAIYWCNPYQAGDRSGVLVIEQYASSIFMGEWRRVE